MIIDIFAVILLVYGINSFSSAFDANIVNLTCIIKASKKTNYLSMDPHNSKKPYAIIQFDEANEKGKLCIDLVLKKWLITRGKKKYVQIST